MTATFSRRTLLVLSAMAWAGSASVALAAPMSLDVPLSGQQQVPMVKTPGSGTAALTYDPGSRDLTWSITYSGLASPVTMAHIHGPAPEGKNGPVVIWLSKKGQPVSSPITGHATLTAAQAKVMAAGDYYINVHTKNHPGGAIRGQIMPPKG